MIRFLPIVLLLTGCAMNPETREWRVDVLYKKYSELPTNKLCDIHNEPGSKHSLDYVAVRRLLIERGVKECSALGRVRSVS